MQEIVLFLIVAVLGGLTWTLSGYLNNWRKNHNNPDWTGFDFKLMTNDAILGVVLGAAVVIIQPISTAIGTPYDVPVITDFGTFIVGIFGMWPIVGMVDKFIIGFVAGK
jgi:uncharacterized membrane protein